MSETDVLFKVFTDADTFMMDEHFCDLVDYARRSIPETLSFETTWMLTRSGWLWISNPFRMPEYKRYQKDSSGEWLRDSEGRLIEDTQVYSSHGLVQCVAWTLDSDYSYRFVCFEAMDGVFEIGADMNLRQGDCVGTLITGAENYRYRDGWLRTDDENNSLHEVRWIYAAMHLMSQRLAMTVRKAGDRQIRRRWAAAKSPIVPEVRFVTLRRMQADRAKAGAMSDIDWQWQWPVKGHWRNQWFPSEQENKTIWIEDYVKGPIDKPMKPAQSTIFNATR